MQMLLSSSYSMSPNSQADKQQSCGASMQSVSFDLGLFVLRSSCQPAIASRDLEG